MAAGGVDEELLQDAYQRIVDGLFSKCFDLKKETTETLSYECMLHRLAAIDSAVNSLKVVFLRYFNFLCKFCNKSFQMSLFSS